MKNIAKNWPLGFLGFLFYKAFPEYWRKIGLICSGSHGLFGLFILFPKRNRKVWNRPTRREHFADGRKECLGRIPPARQIFGRHRFGFFQTYTAFVSSQSVIAVWSAQFLCRKFCMSRRVVFYSSFGSASRWISFLIRIKIKNIEKQNIFILVAAVLALAGLAAFLCWQNGKVAVEPEQTSIEQSSGTVQSGGDKMSIVSVSQFDNFYNIQAEYPQFKDADPAFNQKIADLINGQMENFKKRPKKISMRAMRRCRKGRWFCRNRNNRSTLSPRGRRTNQALITWASSLTSIIFPAEPMASTKFFAFNYDLASKKK